MRFFSMLYVAGALFGLVSCGSEGTTSIVDEMDPPPSDTEEDSQRGSDSEGMTGEDSETLPIGESDTDPESDTAETDPDGGASDEEGSDDSESGDSETTEDTGDTEDTEHFPRSGWKAAPVGAYHSCALDENNKLFCWGANHYGEAGNGNRDELLFAPTAIGTISWKQIAPGNDYTCGISLENDLFCWGRSFWGQTGTSQVYTNDGVPVPTAVEAGSKWKYVATGTEHSCGIKLDGTLWCWGNNYSAQLGLGDFGEPQPRPVKVNTDISDWKHVDVAYQYSCAIRSSGELYCFGFLEDEDLHTKHLKKTPELYFADARWKSVALGVDYRCGVLEDNGLYCFGTNGDGQLGDGTRTELYKTLERIGNDEWKQIAAGEMHTCGVTRKGELFCWGYQQGGRIGNGKNIKEHALTPQKIGNDTDWHSVSVGKWHTCSLDNYGEIYCFGTNEYGQLGQGENVEMTTSPAPIE